MSLSIQEINIISTIIIPVSLIVISGTISLLTNIYSIKKRTQSELQIKKESRKKERRYKIMYECRDLCLDFMKKQGEIFQDLCLKKKIIL